MVPDLTFLPFPRNIDHKNGYFIPQSKRFIKINIKEPQKIRLAAEQLSKDIEEFCHLSWQITASQSLPPQSVGVILEINPEVINQQEGYQLLIENELIQVKGADEPGLFYGIQTLRQIIQQAEFPKLPCLRIIDYPDFHVRGILLDISRDKVYRMETLTMLIDELASWKINQVQLYTEHTFAYIGHEPVWHDSSPMKPEEILALDSFCKERYIDLVPNQNSFGHMSRWLKHPQYAHLAETTRPVETPWGHLQTEPFSLAPTLPETVHFIAGLYDQLLPNFSSSMFNVGCDETFDIGMGRSEAICREIGKGQVYLNYLLKLHQILSERGLTMQFWGDIILQHPNLVPQLPKNVVALNWGYEADHLFKQESEIFQKAGIPYYICPGTSSWNSIGGRFDNMVENCRSGVQFGLQNGADGILITDWGDNGHWQQLPISMVGLVAGAAFSWCYQSNHLQDITRPLNKLVFNDSTESIGQLLASIGNEYKAWGFILPNSSPLFWLLQLPAEDVRKHSLDDLSQVYKSLDRLDANLQSLEKIIINRPDALLVKKEIHLTIQLMQHACQRALLLYDRTNQLDFHAKLYAITSLLVAYKETWLKRNRLGGLIDSLALFNPLLNEYKSAYE